MRAETGFVTRLFMSPSAFTGTVGIVFIFVCAVSAWYFFPTDPLDFVTTPFLRPGVDDAYPLGSDLVGRDLAAGIVHGARVSLLIGVAGSIIAAAIGTLVGLLAGYYRGMADSALMWVTSIFQTMPPFLFAIAVVAILGPQVFTIAFAIGITSWPAVARIVRAETLALRRREFVLSAVSVGMSDVRILLTQILPNLLSPIIVTFSLLVANAILTESGLAFLGLGDPNVASWGSMIGAGREALRTDWYMTAIPGIAIILTVLSLNLLGDGLNDVLNPRLRR